jgi:CRISPR/Cas system-associated exonuclease Cas4 (RecB family)
VQQTLGVAAADQQNLSKEYIIPQVGWLDNSKTLVPFDQALDEARLHGTWESMPYEVLSGIRSNVTKERPEAISVTQTLSCPRKVWLESQHEFGVAPADNYSAFRGQIVHAILEDASEGAVVEERIERVYRGVTISGALDNVRIINEESGHTLVRDWKSVKSLPYFDNPYTHHMQQINIYRWLKGLDWRRTYLEIVYLSMEGVKISPLKRGGTSRTGRAIPNQIWTDEMVEAFLDQKLMILDAQREHGAPVAYMNVDEDDLWQCDYCPVKAICYGMAADEAKAAWARGETVTRVPPRKRKAK